jgi:hypothetical protein
MKSEQELYNALACYTLSLADPEFIHQHIVDAFGAQRADEKTKPIGVVFALAGLYLYLEKNYTGRQVQLAHIQMAEVRIAAVQRRYHSSGCITSRLRKRTQGNDTEMVHLRLGCI